jgi:peroxiredoxin (alkyl hydroperoxide reductase subunit C)
LNEPAPDFQANSTQGPISLGDHKAKWVVLFSHPTADT